MAEQHAFLDLGKRRDWVAARSMLASAPEIVNVQPLGRWSMLHHAAEHGDLGVIGFLLEHGADIASRTSDGRTPLDVAKSEEARAVLAAAESAVAPGLGAASGREAADAGGIAATSAAAAAEEEEGPGAAGGPAHPAAARPRHPRVLNLHRRRGRCNPTSCRGSG